MAKPRVFVSSTYYDLKHLRSSLEHFIESLGFEPVLSEKGDIAYSPNLPVGQSCYREAGNADIFVLIVGGRYGSEAADRQKRPGRSFFERYESITKQEYVHAVTRDVPTYILIEGPVYAEYRTFLKNKTNEQVQYAHVESVNVFHLIEEILSQPKNNPVFPFERYSEIEGWLKEQWAGLFKELLTRMSSQQQITSLSSKVAELGEINATLRTYLEAIMKEVAPSESDSIIASEERRLDEAKKRNQLESNKWVRYVVTDLGFRWGDCIDGLQTATTFEEFADALAKTANGDDTVVKRALWIADVLKKHGNARECFNQAREILGLAPFTEDRNDKKAKEKHTRASRK